MSINPIHFQSQIKTYLRIKNDLLLLRMHQFNLLYHLLRLAAPNIQLLLLIRLHLTTGKIPKLHVDLYHVSFFQSLPTNMAVLVLLNLLRKAVDAGVVPAVGDHVVVLVLEANVAGADLPLLDLLHDLLLVLFAHVHLGHNVVFVAAPLLLLVQEGLDVFPQRGFVSDFGLVQIWGD